MKFIYKISSTAFIALALFVSSAAQAQDKYKTNESIGKQLIENSVPGLKYGPESQQKQAKKAIDPKQETKGEIRDVIFTGGVPSSPTSQSLKTNRTALTKSAPSKLPSDAIAPEKKEKKAEVPKLPPLTQGEDKKAN